MITMKTPDISTIEKVLDNEATAEEAKWVVGWFKTEEGMKWLSERMDKDERQIHLGEEQEWVDHEIPSAVMYQRINQQLRRQTIRRWIFRAAAILIPITLFIGLFVNVNNQIDLLASHEMEEIVVPRGEKMRVIFQDGSSVYLNANSRIRFPKKFTYKDRKVELDGEGLFEVASNKNRPFTVVLDRMKVKVLGTEFNVKAYTEDQDISVALNHGRVELSSGDFQTFELSPGEKAIYDRTSRLCKIVRPQDIAESSAWTTDQIIFEQTPMKDAIQTLSRIYDVTFRIEDKKALNYTYTIKTRQTNILTTLRELEKISPVRFLSQGDTIYVNVKK